MPWTVDSSGSKTAQTPIAATFTNASSTITITGHTLAVNDNVMFTTTGTLPTNFAPFTQYYVVSIATNTITASATRGGSAITAGSAGSGTHTAYFEYELAVPTTVATYVFSADAVNMALLDVLELRCYDKVDGTNYRQLWKGTYQHIQINAAKASPPIAVTTQARFTLRQMAGTGRAFPWSVRRI